MYNTIFLLLNFNSYTVGQKVEGRPVNKTVYKTTNNSALFERHRPPTITNSNI